MFDEFHRALSQPAGSPRRPACARPVLARAPRALLLAALLGSGVALADTGGGAAAARAEREALRAKLEQIAEEHRRGQQAQAREQEQLHKLLRRQGELRRQARALNARIDDATQRETALAAEAAALQRQRQAGLAQLRELAALTAKAGGATSGPMSPSSRKPSSEPGGDPSRDPGGDPGGAPGPSPGPEDNDAGRAASAAMAQARQQAWLREIGRQRSTLQAELARAATRSAALRTEQQALLETLRADRSSLKQREAQLARLEAEHREVLAALERKLDREDRDSQRAQARLVELEELITRLERTAAPPAATPAGTPLARRKGRLRWPLSGPLLRRYGSRNWLERSRGTLVGSPPGTAVAAVHPGTVAWVGWLPQRGLTVILDHGEGYFSLYGHAQAALHGVGDVVPEGEAVIRSGQTGGLERPAVYFELRRGRESLDPRVWFADAP